MQVTLDGQLHIRAYLQSLASQKQIVVKEEWPCNRGVVALPLYLYHPNNVSKKDIKVSAQTRMHQFELSVLNLYPRTENSIWGFFSVRVTV